MVHSALHLVKTFLNMENFVKIRKNLNSAELEALKDKTLCTCSELAISASSKATLSNKNRAKRILMELSELHDAPTLILLPRAHFHLL